MSQKVGSMPHKTSTPNGKEKVLHPPQSKMEVNIWEIKPPDFSYKLYTSLRFPKKPSKTIEEKQGRGKKGNFPETVFHLPSIRNHPKKNTSEFITTFPHLGSNEVKLMFVKSGKYPNGVYVNPKPYDFRQYQCNLPNFVTTYERDPFGLKFKSRHLSTVHGCQSLKDDKQKNKTERFITYKPHECTWDPKLILPKAPWPIKSASYTRHRRRQDVYSAFMDRVEEKFTQTCKSRFSGILGTIIDCVTNPGFVHVPSGSLILEHFFQPANSQRLHLLAQGNIRLPLELPTASQKCWGLISPSRSPQVVMEVIGMHCSPAFPQGAKLQSFHSYFDFVGFLHISLAHLLTLPPFYLPLETISGKTRVLAKLLLLGKPKS